jgi:hypothetical protein
MSLQDVATLATAISGFGVIFTLIFLSIQTQHNTRALRASTFQQVVNSFASISFDIAKDAALSNLYLRAAREFGTFNEVERVQYNFMLLSFLRRAENVYVQSEIHTVHALHWSGIQESISAIMASEGARICWAEMKSRFNPRFRGFVDELIATKQTTTS